MAHDVFIGHAGRDRAVAEAACALLERRGLGCWMASRDPVRAGEALDSSRAFVLILPADSNMSVRLRGQVERALHASIPVLSLKAASGTALDEGLERLSDTVQRVLGAAPEPAPATQGAAARRPGEDTPPRASVPDGLSSVAPVGMAILMVGALLLLAWALEPRVEPRSRVVSVSSPATPSESAAVLPGPAPGPVRPSLAPARPPFIPRPRAAVTPSPARPPVAREPVPAPPAGAPLWLPPLPPAGYATARPGAGRPRRSAAEEPAPPETAPFPEAPPPAYGGIPPQPQDFGPPLPPAIPPAGWTMRGNVLESPGRQVTLSTRLGDGGDTVADGGRTVTHSFVGLGGPVTITARLEGPEGPWMDEIARWVQTLGPPPGGGFGGPPGLPGQPGGMGPPGYP